MTQEQWERVKHLFEAASGLDPADREAFLAQACGDSEIRAEVESLLAEEKHAAGFLEKPVLGRSEQPVRPSELPSQISALALEKMTERYDIRAKVGEGGMGVVYKARDRETNDLVALKILKPEIAAESRVVERFKQELRLARKVTHKNVCRTHELLRFGDAVVIAMEYIEGESLREVLRHPGGVRLGRGLEWTAQICEALSEAHSQGVVHHDLKPENIFVDRDGQIKVMDFGIARSLEASTITTGSIVGTPAYMAPEQAEGKTVDHRADIYALGLILYEMFTGNLAFRADTPMALAFKHVYELPSSLREVEPLLPEYVEKAVLKCLEKEPARRFQSAQELEQALTEVPAGPHRMKLQYPRVAWTLLLLALIALPFMFFGKWLAWMPQPSYHRLTFRRGEVTSARFHPNGTIVYSAAWEGVPAGLFETSAESPESSSLDLKDYTVFSISHTGDMLLSDKNSNLLVRPFNGGAPRPLGNEVSEADWAPDGKDYALVHDADGNDRLEFPAGKVLHETPGSISDLRISPTGDQLAFIEHPIMDDDRGAVYIVDRRRNKKAVSGEYLNARGLAWSAGGKEVWFTAAMEGSARTLYAMTPSGKVRLVAKAPGTLWLYDISSDGRMLLELAIERGFIRGLLSGDTTERDLSWFDYSCASDLSRDGRVLLFDEEGDGGGAKHLVYIRKGDSPAPVQLGPGMAAALSPDGKRALSILDTPPRKLVLLSTSTGEKRELPPGSIDVFLSAEWFPDGIRILINGIERNHHIRCYVQDLTSGLPFAVTPEGTYGCLPSPDNKFVLARGPKKNVSLYLLAGGKPASVRGLDSEDDVIRFAEDIRHLFIFRQGEPQATVIKVYRLDVATGKRELWKEIKVPDPVVDTLDSILLTQDGKFYVCNFRRAISGLYLVGGLR